MLTGIRLTNWIAHRHLDIALSPMTLVCGPNGSGKSSIADSLSYCILADARRVEAKGDRPLMISEGAEEGSVAVRLKDVEICRDIRTGKISTTGPIPFPEDAVTAAAPYITDSARFAGSDADVRRTLLLQVSRVDMSPAGILKKLQERGHPAALLETLEKIENPTLQLLQKAADQGAAEARGAWKALTGEGYGAKKAETWTSEAASMEPPSDEELGYLRQAVESAETRIETMTRAAGAADQIRANSQQIQARNRETEQRIADAATARNALAMLDLPGKEATFETAQNALNDAASRRAPVAMCCPTCRDDLLLEGGRLVSYSAPNNAIDETAYGNFVTTAENAKVAVENARRQAIRLNETIARGEGLELQAVPATPDTDAEAAASLANARRDIAVAKEKLSTALAKAASIVKAAETVQKAAAEHQSVKAWIKMQDALAPSGIPSELLVKTLGRFNETLANLSAGARWRTVAIREDMAVTYGGRAYGLLSESEKWRADIVLTIALASESKLDFAVVDRLDVLEVEARSPALAWFYRLTKGGNVASIMVFGTLKAPPKVPVDVKVYWLGEAIDEKAAA